MTDSPTLFDETDGFVNRPASRERAIIESQSGVRNARHKKIDKYLYNIGKNGATWRELSIAFGLHHGQISGALSNMHKNNEIFALRAVRDRCHPYVHSAYKSVYPDDERFDETIRTVSSLRIELLMRLVDVCRDDINVLNWREQKQRIDNVMSKIDSLGL